MNNLETKSKKFNSPKTAKSFEKRMKQTGQYIKTLDQSKNDDCNYNFKVIYYKNTKKNRRLIGFSDPFDNLDIQYPTDYFK